MAFIFNCSHEMALAANKSEYTPPKIVRRMEDDLKDLSSLINENVIFVHALSGSLKFIGATSRFPT